MRVFKFILKNLGFLALGMMLFASCTYEVFEPEDIPAKFSTDIIPVFDNSCNSAGCHDASSAKAGLDLSPANAYQSIQDNNLVTAGDPDNSVLYTKLLSGTHENRASPGEKALIKKWIELGAEDN